MLLLRKIQIQKGRIAAMILIKVKMKSCAWPSSGEVLFMQDAHKQANVHFCVYIENTDRLKDILHILQKPKVERLSIKFTLEIISHP